VVIAFPFVDPLLAREILVIEIIIAEIFCNPTIVKATFICDDVPVATRTANTTKARRRNGSKAAKAVDPHRDAWIALCRAHASVKGRLQEALTDAGLPPLAWYEVLDAVAAVEDQRMKMGDLATTLVISRGGLTKLVDRLVRAGLIERAYCAEDRRVSYAVLSPAGREMFDEMQPLVVAELRGAFAASLSADQAGALSDALLRVNAAACGS
jgi:DNA-binding MarR family transcriptional regulator